MASASPAVCDGRVYVGTGDSGLLYELDAKTGAPLQKLAFPWIISGLASPAIGCTRVTWTVASPPWTSRHSSRRGVQTYALRAHVAEFMLPDGSYELHGRGQ